jgi:hypothetical protein
MKKIFAIVLISATAFFNSGSFAQKTGKVSSYGARIDDARAIEATRLISQMEGKDSLNIKIRGKVIDVCQRKGCWMNVDLGAGRQMKVRFKDYGFFVPKNCAGKTVVMQGVAYKEETSVEELRHYAEDAGKSKADVEKIKQPEKNTSFEATGVLIYE